MNIKLNYISLFSCAGIGCYGFKLENFECLSTIEINKKRLDIQKYNNKCNKDQYYIDKDITLDFTLNLLDNNLKNKKLDVLIATPPCQGMSEMNKNKKDSDIKRNSLVVKSIEIINKYLPKIFIFENVKTFLKTNCIDIDNNLKSIKQAINYNLNKNYNIEFKIINFKEYGSNSSRNRTLVIGIRKDININPLDLYPKKQKIKTIKECIGNLSSLKKGEIDNNDILHFSRKMNDRHYLWMKNTPINKSAFNNTNKNYIPHLIDNNGNRKEMNNGVKGKFTRLNWNKTMECIHTRNDSPNSQYTIHPKDTRVFSIRELMILQGINKNFKWCNQSYKELNNLSLENKQKWLKKNERLIRIVIGESVPTIIFQQIAKNIKEKLND